MVETRLPETVLAELDRRLAASDAARAAAYPGEPAGRQPVHTVYVPADQVAPGLPARWGAAALAALDRDGGPDGRSLAEATGLDPALVGEVLPRVRAKLAREPVEDLRVDAEDGYRGADPDEDADVRAAGAALGADLRAGTAPPFLGLRAKSLEPATRRRGVRTLDLFLGAMAEVAGRARLPAEILLTLPKVTAVAQVEAMVALCTELERAHGLGAGRLALELQVETPQAVLGADGTAQVAPMVHAAAGRCRGLHYGTYDYSAALGIAAAQQAADHPAADHAKAVLQVAAAGTGARPVDGSTNLLPVGDREAVHGGWRRHARLVDRALRRGFYQGWDLHPAQLLTRYLATYAFFRAALPAALDRLAGYRAGVASGTLDEPATARALAAVLVRALDCGAADEPEVLGPLGLDRTALVRLAGRSTAPVGEAAG